MLGTRQPILWITGTLLASILLLPLGAMAQFQPPTARAIVQRPLLVIAHRGASAHAPENTLPAFELAIQANADLIELDYYHSADGVPVVFHDKELDRTTDAARGLGKQKTPVESLTMDELRRLDAGSWFSPQFAGTRLATLEEALDFIQRQSTTLIEHKKGDARTLAQILRRKQWLDRVVVQSFDWSFLAALHALEPSIVLGALGSKELTDDRLEQVRATGAAVIGWSEKDLQPSDIERVHQAGYRLWVYTVNDPKRAQTLVDARVDGIITDDPALMRRTLRR